MKILLITDQHFGVRNDNQVFIDKYQQFYTGVVLPYIRKNNIKHVICLGDTFDKRKSINFFSLDSAKEMWFDPLRDEGVHMWMLLGNHDIYYKNTLKINAPEALLKGYDNITIISVPTELQFDNRKFLLLPWICDENRGGTRRQIEESDASVCLGHLELNGFEALPGVRMEHGDDPSPFSKFDLVCSGHFHMKSRKENIQYLGNPYQLYWNDYGQKRGFHVLNTDTLKLTFVRNPFDIFSKIFYDDVANDYTEIPDCSHLKGSYVKLIVQNRENQIWFDRYVKSLQENGVADLKIIEDVNLELEDIDDSIKMEDTVTILENYVNDLEDSLDKKNIVTIVKSLYLEALNI